MGYFVGKPALEDILKFLKRIIERQWDRETVVMSLWILGSMLEEGKLLCPAYSQESFDRQQVGEDFIAMARTLHEQVDDGGEPCPEAMEVLIHTFLEDVMI